MSLHLNSANTLAPDRNQGCVIGRALYDMATARPQFLYVQK